MSADSESRSGDKPLTSTTQLHYDVAVIGGGPAGLHAAALLSARGFRVVLFEEHQEIGEPVHCTGLVAAETFEQFDLPADSILNRLRVVHFYPPSGEMFEYTSERDQPLVVNRALFDRRLAERARQHQVVLRLGGRIRHVALEDACVAIQPANGETVRARVCILASGANYSLHRRLGLGMPPVFLQSAQVEIPAPIPDPRPRDVVEIHFGDRVAPRGFAWAVPAEWRGETRLRVGLMCDSDAAAHFERFLSAVAERRGIAAEEANVSPRLKMLPLAPIPRTYGHRLVAIGDAAGLVKATTGGGVYYGLVSAALAAEVLTEALTGDDLTERSLSRYESRWRTRLGAELEAQLSLRRIAQRLTDDQIEGLFDLARHDGVMPIVRRTARFNEHRELIVSLLKHPPVRQLLYRGFADRARRFTRAAPNWLRGGSMQCGSQWLPGTSGDHR